MASAKFKLSKNCFKLPETSRATLKVSETSKCYWQPSKQCLQDSFECAEDSRKCYSNCYWELSVL